MTATKQRNYDWTNTTVHTWKTGHMSEYIYAQHAEIKHTLTEDQLLKHCDGQYESERWQDRFHTAYTEFAEGRKAHQYLISCLNEYKDVSTEKLVAKWQKAKKADKKDRMATVIANRLCRK